MITDESVLTDLGPRLFPLYVLFGTPTDAWDIESDRTQRVLAVPGLSSSRIRCSSTGCVPTRCGAGSSTRAASC